jgi:FkbM family methyltransferase
MQESQNRKGEALPRVRFDLSLMNAIRRAGMRNKGALTPASVAGVPPANPVTPAVRRPFGRAVRVLLAPLLGPARFFRKFLVASIEPRVDYANARIEQIQASLNAVSARQEMQLSAGLDAINWKIDALNTRLDALQIRSDEISIRARSPIHVDDMTVAVRTADGFVLIPRCDTQLFLLLCDAGPQGLEPGTRRVLTKLLSEGMIFIDVGAHVGLLTLAGARAVGPRGRVLAFEPTPATFELLVRALPINGVSGRVSAHRQACGALRERRAFHVAAVLGHSSLLAPETGAAEQGGRDIEVEIVLLDDMVPPGTSVDVVKIDVEGTELDVLAGMTRIIRDSPDLAIIAEFGPAHLARAGIMADAWFKAFYMLGFEGYAIDELSGECRYAHHRDLATVESINILFCRPNSKPAARIKP